MVARRGGADDPHARVPGELDQSVAHATAGAVDENRLSPADPGLAVQHLPGGDAVDDDRLGFGRVDAIGERNEIVGVHEGVGRPPAGLGHRRHASSDQRRVGVGADGGHDADEVVAEHERELGLAGVAVAAHAPLGERHAGGQHLDQCLAVAGDGHGPLVDDEAVGLDDTGEHDLGEVDGGFGRCFAGHGDAFLGGGCLVLAWR